jgi:hypothetical protein
MNGHEFANLYECENEDVIHLANVVKDYPKQLFPALFFWLSSHQNVRWNKNLLLKDCTGPAVYEMPIEYRPGPCLTALLMEQSDPDLNMFILPELMAAYHGTKSHRSK